jgi:hypothetical protein
LQQRARKNFQKSVSGAPAREARRGSDFSAPPPVTALMAAEHGRVLLRAAG